MSILIQDLRIATRQLARRPMFALTAILMLAIGMGVNAVAFTLVNGILFKGPPTRDANDLGRIITTPGSDEAGNASLAEFDRFTDATRGSVDLAAEGRLTVAWRHDNTTETAWVLFVSPNYFPIVKPHTIAGQLALDRGGDTVPSVVIGERFWREKLGARSLSGLTLRLNNISVNVTGVLPEEFRGPAGLYSPDIWLPLNDVRSFNTALALQNRDERWLFLFGQMSSGVTVAAVQGQLDNAVASMAREWPDTHLKRGARFRLLNDPNSELRALSSVAAVAMSIISLVLLIACFNVANLLLARAVERERDIGIRAAIGAGTTRLLRLILTEACVLAAAAGLFALIIARWTQALLGSFAIPIEEPQYIDLSPDLRVVGFVAVLVVFATVVPALWPAFAAARIDVVRVLGSHSAHLTGGRPSRIRRWLVGAQVAGSTAFLIIAVMLVQSYGQLAVRDVGFADNALVIADFSPASHGYDVARTRAYLQALSTRVGALPGVIDVVVADRVPFFIGIERTTPVSATAAPCQPDDCHRYATMAVAPGYFRTMGIGLVGGREFTAGREADEVIINQSLAKQQWPDGRGVGKTLRIGGEGRQVTVVGMTATTQTRGLMREQPTLYVPLDTQHLHGSLSLVARTATAPASLVRPIAEATQLVDPNVAMYAVKTMEQRMAVQLWPVRTLSWMFAICGLLALVLATAGLASVIIHAVQRRVREFGLRLSIGATPRDLKTEVLRSSAMLLLPGLIVGVVLAVVAARLLQSTVGGVNVLDPVAFLAVAVLQTVIVLTACLGPARRAGRIDPLAALRAE